MCLDNTAGNSTNGNPIDLYTCNGGSNQQWTHPDTGAMYNPSTGKCINGSATTVGTQLTLNTCDNNGDQVWIYPSTYNH
jgi:beta-glucosidase